MTASNVKEAFGTSNQAITITLASLASAASRCGAVIDNTTNLYNDALVQCIVKTGTTPASPKIVNVYAYASANGGTNYSDGVSGTDAGATLTVPPNLVLIGTINTPAANTSYTSSPMSVAAAFGGILPDHWGIVIENQSGFALNASGSSAWYQGVYETVG